MGLSQISGVDGLQGLRPTLPSAVGGRPMILNAIAEKLKRRSKDDFKGRHFQASLSGFCANQSQESKINGSIQP